MAFWRRIPAANSVLAQSNYDEAYLPPLAPLPQVSPPLSVNNTERVTSPVNSSKTGTSVQPPPLPPRLKAVAQTVIAESRGRESEPRRGEGDRLTSMQDVVNAAVEEEKKKSKKKKGWGSLLGRARSKSRDRRRTKEEEEEQDREDQDGTTPPDESSTSPTVRTLRTRTLSISSLHRHVQESRARRREPSPPPTLERAATRSSAPAPTEPRARKKSLTTPLEDLDRGQAAPPLTRQRSTKTTTTPRPPTAPVPSAYIPQRSPPTSPSSYTSPVTSYHSPVGSISRRRSSASSRPRPSFDFPAPLSSSPRSHPTKGGYLPPPGCMPRVEPYQGRSSVDFSRVVEPTAPIARPQQQSSNLLCDEHGVFGVTGLRNLGNTCYMAACMQLLSAAEPFSRFFLTGEYLEEINTTSRLGSQGRLAEATAQLITRMRKAATSSISPAAFMRLFTFIKPDQFELGRQHDAQEFLIVLMDALHEDLNLVERPSAVPHAVNSPEREAELEQLPEIIAAEQEWETHREKNDSVVLDLFQGLFRNRMTCLVCKQTSTTYSAGHLALPFPEPSHHSQSNVDLADCINEFLRAEKLSGEDAWNCLRCRGPRPASKRLTISRLPPILVISLKRFVSFEEVAEKVDTPVDFPLDNLALGDLLPTLPRSMRGEGDDGSTERTYELFGVICHYSDNARDELASGHYTAIVRNGPDWLEIDDEEVHLIGPNDVLNARRDAYMLWYRLQ